MAARRSCERWRRCSGIAVTRRTLGPTDLTGPSRGLDRICVIRRRLEIGRPGWVLLEAVLDRDLSEQKVMWVGPAADYFDAGFGESDSLLSDEDVQEALGRADLLVVAEAPRFFDGGLPED